MTDYIKNLSRSEIVGLIITFGLNLIVIDYYVSGFISLTYLAGLQTLITGVCSGVPWMIERDEKDDRERIIKGFSLGAKFTEIKP